MSYPLIMTHPNFSPAVLQDEAKGIDGAPAVFPPEVVNDRDQEGRLRSLGYFAMGEVTEDYTFQEYPKWVDEHTVVNSAAEEKAWKKKNAAPAE